MIASFVLVMPFAIAVVRYRLTGTRLLGHWFCNERTPPPLPPSHYIASHIALMTLSVGLALVGGLLAFINVDNHLNNIHTKLGGLVVI